MTTTIAAGNTSEIYCPLATDVTFTPGSGGTMRVSVAVLSGAAVIAPQFIQSATTISISAGATVFAEAIDADATYTDPAFTSAEVAAIQAFVSEAVTAPAAINSTNAATYNGKTVNLAAGDTLTVADSSWTLIPLGVGIQVGQSGSATLAFSGTATKENSSGTSAVSVTLEAAGIYALVPSQTGSPKFRLVGGSAL